MVPPLFVLSLGTKAKISNAYNLYFSYALYLLNFIFLIMRINQTAIAIIPK